MVTFCPKCFKNIEILVGVILNVCMNLVLLTFYIIESSQPKAWCLSDWLMDFSRLYSFLHIGIVSFFISLSLTFRDYPI